MKHPCSGLSQTVSIVGLLAACVLFAAPCFALSAQEILEATGVKSGLIVHIGCGDGEMTAALGQSESYLVHGLDPDAGNVGRARERIIAAGRYGRVSVEQWAGGRLPYTDNLVSLAVVQQPDLASREEIMRVLSPNGVAYVRSAGRAESWTKITKPRPAETDDWTHALYDASNNAVADDQLVGPPYHLQWVAQPRNARHHESLASVSVVVEAAGRLFYIIDEAPTASVLIRPKWMLVARNAYNGIVLWKRNITSWESHRRAFRDGPPDLSRRLVATEDALYVTLSYVGPVLALDPDSGETMREYEATKGAREILHRDGVLYLVVDEAPGKFAVMAVRARTGDTIWKRTDLQPLPVTLAVSGGRAFLLDAKGLVCLDAETGADIWRTPREVALKRPGWSSPNLLVYDDVVLCADRDIDPDPNLDPKTGKTMARWLCDGGATGKLTAFSSDAGKELWSCPAAETYHAQIDVFVADGLVWVGQSRSRTNTDFTDGRDLHTGEIRRTLATDKAFDTTMPHHRCHRNRATNRYILTGRTGIEFIDLRTGESARHHWVRGVCQYGFIPANGLMYMPPHSCACYIEAKLTGFQALAPKRGPTAPGGGEARAVAEPAAEERVVLGPAYSPVPGTPSSPSPDAAVEWPTYRHDAGRSGFTAAPVAVDLKPSWEAKLGGPVSSPVIAAGKVFVAEIDAHTVHALDALTGAPIWRFTSGGRVDSPPTFNGGLVVFGSADGYVYCLQATDGQLVWRLQAAPEDRRIWAFGQLESAWPVHGSVLIENGVVYFVAGRSSYLDGGLHVYRVSLTSGKVLSHKVVYSRDAETGEQPEEPMMFEIPGAQPDVLSTDGEMVYMRKVTMDPESLEPQETRRHLYSPAGFLNGDWWHRTYWIYGTHFYSGYIGWYFAGREAPAGRLMSYNDSAIYGFSYKPDFYRGATGREYHLFATSKEGLASQDPPDYQRANRDYPASGERKFKVDLGWSSSTSILARAMAVADKTIFIAGPPDTALRSMPAFEGKKGSFLHAISATDGKLLKQYQLGSLPAYDGMAAAYGRLYLATEDGRLLCAQDAEQTPTAPAGELDFLGEVTAEGPKPMGEPVEPGLAGHWTLDDGEDELAVDTSGLGSDADVFGQWVKGDFGTCILTNGSPGAVTIEDGQHLHFGTGDFSLMFWIKPDRWDARIMGKEAFPQEWWVINLLNDGRLEMVIGQGTQQGKTVRPTSKRPLAIEKWTHLAAVVDRQNRQVRWYMDGVLDSTTEIPETLDGDLSIKGKSLMIPSSYKPLVGLFDEFRVYKRALTEAEIKTRYEQENPTRSSVAFERAW